VYGKSCEAAVNTAGFNKVTRLMRQNQLQSVYRWKWKPKAGVVHNSDCGSQYGSFDFQKEKAAFLFGVR